MRVGPHVTRDWVPGGGTIAGNIMAAVYDAGRQEFEVEVVQIFVAGPRTRKMVCSAADAKEIRALPVEVYAHGTYTDVPWNGGHSAAKFVAKELAFCDLAGIRGLVIHLPCSRNRRGETDSVVDTVGRIVRSRNSPERASLLFLENPPGGFASGTQGRAEDIGVLVGELRARPDVLEKTGVCIDVGHLWSAGVDVRSPGTCREWLERSALAALPPGHVLFHFNDSANELGAGTDKHAELFHGRIWGGYRHKPNESGLAEFFRFARAHDIAIILERRPNELLRSDYRYISRLGDIRGPPDGRKKREDTF